MGRLKAGGGGGDESDIETVRRVVKNARHHITLVVRLESVNPLRKRYLVIISTPVSSSTNTSAQQPINKGESFKQCRYDD